MIKTPSVSVVIPTMQRPDALIQTIRAVDDQVFDGAAEIIVVDDGSRDATPQMVASTTTRLPLKYIFQDQRGVAAARNCGAASAENDFLLFLDDDIVIPRDFLSRAFAALEETGADLFNPRWEFPPEFERVLRAHPFGRFRVDTETWVKTAVDLRPIEGSRYAPSGVTACALLLARRAFNSIGGFDEMFPHAGCEDQDFSHRAKHAGYSFVLDDSIVVWHNDRRLSLEQFCARQRRGAVTAVVLARKYPETHWFQPLIQENLPIASGDSPRLKVKKLAKKTLAFPLLTAAFMGFVHALESIAPNSRFLARLYRVSCGVFIYRGVQEGAKRYGLAQ